MELELGERRLVYVINKLSCVLNIGLYFSPIEGTGEAVIGVFTTTPKARLDASNTFNDVLGNMKSIVEEVSEQDPFGALVLSAIDSVLSKEVDSVERQMGEVINIWGRAPLEEAENLFAAGKKVLEAYAEDGENYERAVEELKAISRNLKPLGEEASAITTAASLLTDVNAILNIALMRDAIKKMVELRGLWR